MEIVESEIVEKFRDIANAFDWGWSHGRTDFHNLSDLDGTDGKWHFFLDPVSEDSNDETALYEGHFMILSVSDLDQNYDGQKETSPEEGKWIQNIKPKKTFLKNDFRKQLYCLGDFEILRYKMTDVINFFDNNMDGVLVSFLIREYL